LDPTPREDTWGEAWADEAFRRRAIATVPVLAAVLGALAGFVKWVERRPGVVVADPLLEVLRPRDLTWLTFALIYAGLIGGVALLSRRPRRLLRAVQAYAAMAVIRMAVMWATPLDPPPGMIRLDDPFVQRMGGAAEPLTRDLFFSGHTSTLFLLALAAPGARSRMAFFACTGAVAACVLVQHVHYTVDVLAAPFFALGAWGIAGAIARPRRAPGG